VRAPTWLSPMPFLKVTLLWCLPLAGCWLGIGLNWAWLEAETSLTGTPAEVRIRYDPAWPPRAWLEGVRDQEHLYMMNGSVIMFGVILTALLFVLKINWPQAAWPSYETGPFLALSLVLLLSGLGKLLLGEVL
jgi:hypothetical protein